MAEIIFISITLFILVGVTFYLEVPKASIPLFIIYLIFIIKNQLNPPQRKYQANINSIQKLSKLKKKEKFL